MYVCLGGGGCMCVCVREMGGGEVCVCVCERGGVCGGVNVCVWGGGGDKSVCMRVCLCFCMREGEGV